MNTYMTNLDSEKEENRNEEMECKIKIKNNNNDNQEIALKRNLDKQKFYAIKQKCNVMTSFD